VKLGRPAKGWARLRGVLVYALVLGLLMALAAQGTPPKGQAAKPGDKEKEPGPQASPQPDPSANPSPSPSANPSLKPSPSPSPTPKPSPSPRPSLRLNLERHVEKHIEQQRGPGTPHFEESVDVEDETPQTMLERHYEGLHLECGGLEGGAPTEAETRAVRPHISPSADFLPLVGALRKALGKNKEPRFFLYRITRQGKVSYDVRSERVSGALLGQPGVEFDLLETFSDMDDAKRALQRMEHGFDRPVPSSEAPPPPPWATAQPCRPK
jgi:hypothetical protein